MQPRLLTLSLLACLCMASACATSGQNPGSSCAGGDDLAAAAKCFHLSTDPQDRYALLSAESRAAISPEAWLDSRPVHTTYDDGVIAGGSCQNLEVTVLDRPATQGTPFGLVELRRRCDRRGKACHMRETRLWRREGEGWRRVSFPLLAKAAGDAWNQERWDDLPAVAGAWRKAAPLSVAAQRLWGWALMRGLAGASPASKAKHVQAMRDLNPRDSQTHLLAASLSPGFAPGVETLKGMEADDCLRGIATNNVLLQSPSAEQSVAVMDQLDPTKKEFGPSRIEAYIHLNLKDEAIAILQGQEMEGLLKTVQGDGDEGSRFGYGMWIGSRALELGRGDLALPWLKLARSAKSTPDLESMLKAAQGAAGTTPSPGL